MCEPLLAGADARAALDRFATRRPRSRDDRGRLREARIRRPRRRARRRSSASPSSRSTRSTLPADPLVAVIEGVEKPGNLGAVLRTADGAGVDALIAASPRTDLVNPNVIRASAGTAFSVPLAAGADRRGPRLAAGPRRPDRRGAGRRGTRLHRCRSHRPAGDRAGQRGRRPHRAWRARTSRRSASRCGRGRQPQRVGRRGRAAVRGAPAARRSCTGQTETDAPDGPTFDFVIIGAGPAGEAAATRRASSVRRSPSSIGAGSAAAARTSAACRRSRCSHGAARARREPGALRVAAGIGPSRLHDQPRRPTPPSPTTPATSRALEKAGAVVYRGDGADRRSRPRRGQPRRAHATSWRRTNVDRRGRVGLEGPPIDGHRRRSRSGRTAQATLARELPTSLLILGGGPTGCELAQVYARFGVPTTIVQSGPRLAPTDHPRNSEVVRQALEARRRRRSGPASGRCGRGPGRAGRRARHRARRRLDRRGPRGPARGRARRSRSTTSASSTTASTRAAERRIPRDGRLRIADGLWVVGDPAGPELHTHQAHYQGELAVRMALGEHVDARLPGAAAGDVHRSRGGVRRA